MKTGFCDCKICDSDRGNGRREERQEGKVSDFAKVEDEFRAALEARGIMAPAALVADGQIHHLPTHDKPKTKNGRYTLHLDAKPAGYIENMGDVNVRGRA